MLASCSQVLINFLKLYQVQISNKPDLIAVTYPLIEKINNDIEAALQKDTDNAWIYLMDTQLVDHTDNALTQLFSKDRGLLYRTLLAAISYLRAQLDAHPSVDKDKFSMTKVLLQTKLSTLEDEKQTHYGIASEADSDLAHELFYAAEYTPRTKRSFSEFENICFTEYEAVAKERADKELLEGFEFMEDTQKKPVPTSTSPKLEMLAPTQSPNLTDPARRRAKRMGPRDPDAKGVYYLAESYLPGITLEESFIAEETGHLPPTSSPEMASLLESLLPIAGKTAPNSTSSNAQPAAQPVTEQPAEQVEYASASSHSGSPDTSATAQGDTSPSPTGSDTGERMHSSEEESKAAETSKPVTPPPAAMTAAKPEADISPPVSAPKPLTQPSFLPVAPQSSSAAATLAQNPHSFVRGLSKREEQARKAREQRKNTKPLNSDTDQQTPQAKSGAVKGQTNATRKPTVPPPARKRR